MPRKLIGYQKVLNVTDGDATAYDTAAEVGALVEAATAATTIWTRIWELTVPAQVRYRWGWGNPAFQFNQGFLSFFAIDNGTGFEEGFVRLLQTDAREVRRIVVAEFHSTSLHLQVATPSPITAQPVDRNFMQPFPERRNVPFVGEDSKMVIEWKPTSATTTVDYVDFRIPITVYQ